MGTSRLFRATSHGRDARVTLARRLSGYALAACFGILSAALPTSAQTLEIVNNQPFDVRQPLRLRGVALDGPASTAAQPAGKGDLVVMIDVPASQSKKVPLSGAGVPQQVEAQAVAVKPDRAGVAITAGGRDMGTLAWGVVVGPAPTEKAKGDPAPSTKRDFAASFSPIALRFEPTADGPLFKAWTATGSGSGLRLDVTLVAYATGFLDVHATVTNESAPRDDVYAALVTRWEQPKVAGRSMGYDNRRSALDEGGYSPFRSGEGRHLYIQRGLDWVNTKLDGGAGAVWMNGFTPSFTVHRDATETKDKATGKATTIPPRWVGANGAHVAQEAQAAGGALYSVSEIAHPNLKQYDARLQQSVLPDKAQPLTITSRLAFDATAVTDDAADQRFVAYAGYNPQQVTTVGGKVTFGVPYTRVGTNYFPYSTLGENFGKLRMKGMSKEGYWPLAPQTVLQWETFADDIRRDLRILKAMGYDLCRLHHLEVLWDDDPATGKPYIPEAKRWEYLDFFFGEIERLQLKALLDVKLPAKDVAELVKRYGRLCDGVEYDNEVLIFQIPDEDVPLWKDVYDAVKKVDPNMPFHLTAHTNMGAFDRLAKLGVKVDRIGQHAYLDGVEPIPSSRDYSLAAGNYAAKVGKEAQITEWNWRFLTRMPMEERAKVYGPIFENVFAARSVPTVYQFQFQDSLAMNPATLKGIRRYEQLLLSRRPKPEAMVMAALIAKYGPPDSGVRKIDAGHPVVELTNAQGGGFTWNLVNRTDKPMPVTLSVETSADLNAKVSGPRELVLESGKPAGVPVEVMFADGAKALPGFYHVFLRVEGKDAGTLRYGWAEVRKPGQPTFAPSESGEVVYGPGALDFNLDRPLTIVYPDEATVWELEAAWTVFITLESATGRPADIYQASDLAKLPAGGPPRTIVHVTRDKGVAKPTVRVDGERLVIAGASEKDVSAAAMDYVVRFWKNAKDAGARKVGLVEAKLGDGGVATDLDR
jgi:hypothetical protein